MIIRVNPSLDMETMRWTAARSYEHTGAILWLKGDPTAQAAEKEQMLFSEQLMNIFNQQYNSQKNVLGYLQNQLQPQISTGGQGFSPLSLTAMRTQASDTLAQQGQNARQAAMEEISARSGGSKLVGAAGTTAQVLGAIDTARAAQEANAQNAITTEDAALKNANYWNAINVLNGTAAMTNPLGYASSAEEGGNVTGNLSQAVTAANGPTLGQTLGGLAGGIAGGFLANPKFKI